MGKKKVIKKNTIKSKKANKSKSIKKTEQITEVKGWRSKPKKLLFAVKQNSTKGNI